MKTAINIKKEGNSVIAVRNLGKKYGDFQAVNGLTFEVKPGKTLVLTGPSGCGKTTTLRLIAGLEQPDWGEIRLQDRQASTPTHLIPVHQRHLSMVFQDLALWPHMTVTQHLDFTIDHKKYRGKPKKQKINEILNLVQLKQQSSYPHQLSGGEQQRLAIARALASEPDILLFDEPLSNLDYCLKQQLLKELKKLFLHLQITVVYVTHQPEEAMYLADTVAVMAHGSIKSLCTVDEFSLQQQKIRQKNCLTRKRRESKNTVIRLESYVA